MSQFECDDCKKIFKRKENLELHHARCKVQRSRQQEEIVLQYLIIESSSKLIN